MLTILDNQQVKRHRIIGTRLASSPLIAPGSRGGATIRDMATTLVQRGGGGGGRLTPQKSISGL